MVGNSLPDLSVRDLAWINMKNMVNWKELYAWVKNFDKKATTLGGFDKKIFKTLKIARFGAKITDFPLKIRKLFWNFFQKSTNLANLRVDETSLLQGQF